MLEKQAARWYPLIPHPEQTRLIAAVDNGTRFPLVPAGRRSGKTERAKRFLVKKANELPGLYFAAAPTHEQAKKIWWSDLKDLTFSAMHDRRPSESDRIIYLPNGSEIQVIGLDKPERVEGIPWAGGMIDEIADIKPTAWLENILPALNTVNPTRPSYLAWCWLLGVPDGLNHYYEMCEEAKDPENTSYEVFTWFSADILDKLNPSLLKEQRRLMSARQYRQEYEASFEAAMGRIYEEYGKHNHTAANIQPDEQIHWMHDFNYSPLSSALGVIRNDNDLYLLDEIVLQSAVARQTAVEFVNRYQYHKNKHVVIYGDPSGRAGEKHGHTSDYVEIEKVLRDNGWRFTRKVKKRAPGIVDRQNAVRAKILNAAGETSLFVNIKTCKYVHKGLATTELKEGSSFIEIEDEYQHITTAIGYCAEYLWPVRHLREAIKASPLPTKHHWG